MSEETGQEKWESSEWFVITKQIRPRGGGTKSYYRKYGLGYGTISLERDKVIVGEFSINYSDILSVERHKKFPYMLVSCSDGNTYWFTMFSKFSRMNTIEQLISALKHNLNQYEPTKISEAIEFIKNLPQLYKEITLDDLSSRTKLKGDELIKILENMILDKELNAEFRGNLLHVKQTPSSIASPKGYELNTSIVQESQQKEGLLIFVSYATKDTDLYKIPEIAHQLEAYKEIGEVLYWQEDMHDSIIEYMNDNLGRCDVVLLFCSPNALDSVPVKKEWMAAEDLKKPIIPIFVKPEHIPPLLSDRLGFEFDTFDFQKNIQEIYELILKKKQG